MPHFSCLAAHGDLVELRVRVLLVVVTTGDDHQCLVVDAVNQPMGVINAARPKAREVFFQGLGFANALEGVAQAVFDQGVDALKGLAVLALPVFGM